MEFELGLKGSTVVHMGQLYSVSADVVEQQMAAHSITTLKSGLLLGKPALHQENG
jgi:hypothetical protein